MTHTHKSLSSRMLASKSSQDLLPKTLMMTTALVVSQTIIAMEINVKCLGEDDDAQPSHDSVTVIDIVDAHRLKEVELDKKAWTSLIKGIINAFFLLST